jgi:DNA-binding transcriptional LysR family regulator
LDTPIRESYALRPLKLDQLKAFVEVAKHGSFTAAAKVMNLSQPAITHQVHELEQRFQVALFDRVGNRVFLTKAGQKLHEYAVPLLEHDVNVRTAMRGFVHGWVQQVRIGSSMTMLMYLLPPVLRQLKTDHPNLEINFKTGLTSSTLRLLKENELDLGLCALPVEDPAFDIVSLLSDDLMAILPATLPHAPETVTPAFLSCVPLILGNKESALRRSVTEWLAQSGPVPKPVMELDNVEAIKGVVGVGVGSSIVPGLALGQDKITPTKLAVRPIDPPMIRQVGLAKLRGKHMSDAVSAVYEALLSLRTCRCKRQSSTSW